MKNIGKIKAIIISSIVTLVLIAGLIFSFVPMKLGNKDYESFAGALNQGISINGGMSVEYTIKGTYTDKQLNSSLAKITELVQEYGYESVVAYKKGEDKIRVDLNGPVLYDDRNTAESFLKQIATGKLEFKNKNDASATLTPKEGEEVDPNLIIINASEHIESITKVNYQQQNGIKIEFNKTGKRLYSKAVNQPLYMFVGGTAWPSANDNNKVQANTDANSSTMYMMFNSSDVVDSYYYTLKAGMLDISLDSENVEVVYNTSKSALTVKVASIVASIVVLVGLIVLFSLKYKGLGIPVTVTNLLMVCAILYLMQAMNWVTVGASTIVASVVLMVANYIINSAILGGVNKEQLVGKSMETAVSDSYKKHTPIVIDALVVLFVIGATLAIATTGDLKGIGTMVALFAVLTMFNTLLFNRLLINCMYSFTPNPAKFLGLKAEGGER